MLNCLYIGQSLQRLSVIRWTCCGMYVWIGRAPKYVCQRRRRARHLRKSITFLLMAYLPILLARISWQMLNINLILRHVTEKTWLYCSLIFSYICSMNREISFKDAAEMQGFTKLGLTLKSFRHYMENHRQQIVYLIVFFGVCILVSAERFYCKSKLCSPANKLLY